jgi:xylan 1,4-beta-xylosidase
MTSNNRLRLRLMRTVAVEELPASRGWIGAFWRRLGRTSAAGGFPSSSRWNRKKGTIMSMAKRVSTCVVVLLGAIALTEAQPKTFVNPVISGFHPDPSVCRVGDDYYLVNSTFEYFPGVPVHHSRDLVHWRLIGYCLTRDSQLRLTNVRSSGGIYAPTIRYNKGTFYMITTLVGGRGNFYVTAQDPAGPWSDPVWLDGDGIDPSLFFDDDGTTYYTRHVGGGDGYIGQTKIDLKTGALAGDLREIWRGTGGIWPEGPHLYKYHNKYYLMIAEGGTDYGHRETIASGDSPMGPFFPNPNNPILTHHTDLKLPIQALGHADMVETPDGWWAVCLGIRPRDGRFHVIGRETFLAPVTWSAEGWPVIGTKGSVDLTMPAPQLKEVTWPEEAVRDDFTNRELGLHWNYLRNPHSEQYSLKDHPGFLRLKGSALTLNDKLDSPAFVGRRQEHLSCRVATKLSFTPANENEEAGLVIRADEKNHLEIAVTFFQGQRTVVYRRVRRKKVFQEMRFPAPGAGDVTLIVDATPLEYKFSFALGKGSTQAAGSCRPKELSTEKIGGFTGTYVALYATGNGKPCEAPADFDWFEYTPIEK